MTPRIRHIELGSEQLVVYEGSPGERVRVVCGAAWLTQEGEPGDVVLRAGAELPLRAGRTVIQALEPARLQILGVARLPGAGQRLVRHLRRWALRLQLGPLQPEPVA